MRYKITPVFQDITENITIMAEDKYGGWIAVNTGSGSAMATVLGYPLMPGEKLDYRDVVRPGDIWDAPIQITVNPGAKIRLTRLQCRPIGKEE